MTATNQEIITQIASALSALVPPKIPLDIDLWGSKEVAAYLKKSPEHVMKKYTCLPSFPSPIYLPGTGSRGRSQPLFRAREVIAWAVSHQKIKPLSA